MRRHSNYLCHNEYVKLNAYDGYLAERYSLKEQDYCGWSGAYDR